MSISTRRGDDGRTQLFSGEKVPKYHPRPSTYGDLDEAVSAMGLARSLCRSRRVGETLHRLQRRCFAAGAELATVGEALDRLPERLGPEDLQEVDDLVEHLEEEITLPPVFVVPGGTPGSAALDLARSVLRRVERGTVRLADEAEGGLSNPVLLPWLNRSSDLLFLLARLEEQEQGVAYDRLKEA